MSGRRKLIFWGAAAAVAIDAHCSNLRPSVEQKAGRRAGRPREPSRRQQPIRKPKDAEPFKSWPMAHAREAGGAEKYVIRITEFGGVQAFDLRFVLPELYEKWLPLLVCRCVLGDPVPKGGGVILRAQSYGSHRGSGFERTFGAALIPLGRPTAEKLHLTWFWLRQVRPSGMALTRQAQHGAGSCAFEQ